MQRLKINSRLARAAMILLVALCAHLTAGAQKTVINVVSQTAHITRTSTLYVGEVVLNNQRSFYYLYSDDITNSSNVLGAVRDCLQDFKGGIFSTLVSNEKYIGEGTGITACSNAAYESMMSSDWKDADKAGQACLPSRIVAASSSDNLFDKDADFAEKCSNLLSSNGIDLVDNEGNPLAVSGVLGVLSSTSKDAVTYQVIEGELVKLTNRTIEYDDESVTVFYTRAVLFDPYEMPLTFEALEDGTISISNPNGRSFVYCVNYSGKWEYVELQDINIDVSANDIVQFRGNISTLVNSVDDTQFSASGNCYVYGNVMSLLSRTNYATMTTVSQPYCFKMLFCSPDRETNTTILNHPTYDILLPATTVSAYGYGYMFYGCQGITRAPQLPATTLGNYCYENMFAGCTSLLNAPELPATTLVEGCYSEMFQGCTSLTRAPVLPAATLAENCYNCMFYDCNSLNYVKCLATNISANDCTTDWLNNVAETGTFVKAEYMINWAVNSANGIPTGWTEMNNFVLVDNGDNSDAINSAGNSALFEVTLSGRTLYKDGYWNTLCLPFDVSTTSGPLAGDDVVAMTLDADNSGLSGSTLTLNFTAATSIPAGTPFIIKWGTPESHPNSDLVNPVFTSVTIDNSTEAIARKTVTSTDQTVSFKGTYTSTTYESEDKIILLLGANNTLYWPKPEGENKPSIGAFRAYFQLTDPNTNVREFKLNFDNDDESTGITTTNYTNFTNSDSWYDMSGRRLSGKPTKAGLYINKGRKVVIK